ncbi:MAG: alpha/beta hydrolase [Pseudomonadota bacterium]
MPTFQTADGLTLHFTDDGAGLPLLCLAGLSRNTRDFEPVVARFAESARVICLDSRGRGASDFDPDYHNYNVLQESLDALALLDHLGIEKAAILGTSRGGLIAMTLAVGHKDRLRGVFLNDIGPLIEPAGLAHIFTYLGNRPQFSDYDDAAEKLEVAMAARFPGVSRAAWRVYAERIWREVEDGLDLRYDPNLRRASLEQSAGDQMPNLWPLYDALQDLPIALLRGANSDLLSAETARKMIERHPGVLYAEVPDRGHVPFLDEPQSIALIEDFLKAVK